RKSGGIPVMGCPPPGADRRSEAVSLNRLRLPAAGCRITESETNRLMIASTASDIQRILERSLAGARLTPDEGVALLRCHELTALGQAADAITRRLHPEP